MMIHSTSSRLTHTGGEPFSAATGALTAVGFRVVAHDEASIEFVGPGWNSTSESALIGASRVHLRTTENALRLEAELGGVARMTRFLLQFPIGALAVAMVVLLIPLGASPVAVRAVAINFVLWLILAPILIASQRRRTCEALDALVTHCASQVAPSRAAVAERTTISS